MKIKDKVLSLSLSIILIVSGLVLLLDQLDVKFIDEFFTPWYTILILYFTASSLAIAITKKSPIFYVITMLLASIYLCISLPFKAPSISIYDIIFIVPLFIGIGLVMADIICKWSTKAVRLGLVLIVSSTIILISTILNVWTIVIPIVIILIGIVYVVFTLIDVKKNTKDEQSHDHYVQPTKKDNKENDNINDSLDNSSLNEDNDSTVGKSDEILQITEIADEINKN